MEGLIPQHSSFVLYITVKRDRKSDWKLDSEEYKRPTFGHGCYVSFPVPDGQNLASPFRALCYDLAKCLPMWRACERVLLQYVCGEMERLQTEGRRRRGMGSLNAIVSPVVQSPSTSQEWMCSDGLQSPQKSKLPPFPSCQLSCTRPLLIGTLARTGWKITRTKMRIQFCFQICRVK